MQRVFAVRFSGDATYVFSGSDDMNVRCWKAKASEQLGVRLPAEKHKQAYNEALLERYKHMPEVRPCGVIWPILLARNKGCLFGRGCASARGRVSVWDA